MIVIEFGKKAKSNINIYNFLLYIITNIEND